MVPGQVKGKMKGKGAFGYGSAEVMEVDPVSLPTFVLAKADVQNVIDWDKHTIRGTSTKLEKSYLRLTSVSPVYISPSSEVSQFSS